MTYIKGTITLDDGEKIEFDCSTEEEWNQWGNSTKNLGRVVDLTTKIQTILNSIGKL